MNRTSIMTTTTINKPVTRRSWLTMVLALMAMMALPTLSAPLLAQDAKLAELRKRFEERDPEIRQLKKAGAVGETSDGYLDFVKEKKSADLVEQENADRKELYRLIAKKEAASAEVVAERAAKRNFEKARAGEWLKEEGKWRRKGSE